VELPATKIAGREATRVHDVAGAAAVVEATGDWSRRSRAAECAGAGRDERDDDPPRRAHLSFAFSWSPGSLASTARAISTIGTERSWLGALQDAISLPARTSPCGA
jgi:hypothetical protein